VKSNQGEVPKPNIVLVAMPFFNRGWKLGRKRTWGGGGGEQFGESSPQSESTFWTYGFAVTAQKWKGS